MMTKQQLRRQYLSMRNGMTDGKIKSEQIALRLYESGAKQWKHIFCYLSFGNEADTIAIVQQMLEWGTAVSVPVCSPADCTMTPSVIDSLADCTKNCYGILEPAKIIPPDMAFDAVLVPGVVFSRTGHRIGFGKGYYDRFLHTVSGSPLKIGLCYDWQLLDDIPHEPHDVTMDWIMTEERTLVL